MPKSKFFCIFAAILLFMVQGEAHYITRFATTTNGGVLFTGNTLGLTKLPGKNQAGTSHSNGAFITTDTTQQVPTYPIGTTLTWQNNSSSAFLDLPPGSTILYAELVWSGSYGFQNQITGNEPNSDIHLTLPDGTTWSITPDPTTAQVAVTPGYENIPAGNYTRSAIVTDLVAQGGAGQYIAGGIPATISGLDDTHNSGGWTLAVVFQNSTYDTYNLAFFVGCEQASYTTNLPAEISGFCAPPPPTVIKGNLFVSAVEGDAVLTGDHMLFGPTSTLTMAANSLSGSNNYVNNFFASQINTIFPGIGTSALLDTRGSFGNSNANPAPPGTNVLAGRQGYDITSVPVSNLLQNNQTTAYALGTTTGDDYTINALATQIQVGAPVIERTKTVNGATSANVSVGDVVTFVVTLKNTGTSIAFTPKLIDALESEFTYKTGSFKINSQPQQQDPNLTAGYSFANLGVGQTITFQYQATVNGYPPVGNIIPNTATMNYDYITCLGTSIHLTADTNTVTVSLPTLDPPSINCTKWVNSAPSIFSKVGDTVTFSFTLTNSEIASALNVFLVDRLDSELRLVPASVFVNNNLITPDPNLSNPGIPVGSIQGQETIPVIFQAKIIAYPPGGMIPNTATVNYQYLDSFGQLQNLIAQVNAVVINLAAPPGPFVGRLKACHTLNGTNYCLNATWQAAPSSDVVAYRVYANNRVILQTGAAGPFTYQACVKSLSTIQGLMVVAVYPDDQESPPIPLFIEEI